MTRTSLVSLAAATGVALAALAGPAAAKAPKPALDFFAAAARPEAPPKTVKGTVGPGFSISLTLGGKKVSSLKAGVPYRFHISDRSSIHDFHLSGPGLSRVLTGVSFTGSKSATLTLEKGDYRYVCDAHAGSMKGSFKVA
jgi:hypothetical protein